MQLLLTISQTLKKYQYINDKTTISHTENLELKKIAIVEKYGKKEIKIPAYFNFYIMILCLTGGSIRKVNQYEYNVKEYSLQLIPPNSMHSFYDIFENTKYYVILFEKDFSSEVDILNFHDTNFDNVVG